MLGDWAPAREVEKAITAILPEAKIPRKELRALNQSESLLKLVIDDEVLKKLDLIKSLYSHRKPGMTYRGLIEMLANDVLKVKAHRNSGAGESARHIPPALKQKIRERDGGRCTYVDPLSKRRCESTQLLEFDHIRPAAFGGRATEDNLRLLCRAHNQLAARDQGLLRPSLALAQPNIS